MSMDARRNEMMENWDNPKGGADVNVQDQTTPPIIAYFSIVENETLLSANAEINDYTFTVVDSTGFVAGQYLSLFSLDGNRFYLANVLGVNGSLITVDTPLDFAYQADDFVTVGDKNMNVDGSVTPIIFGIRNTDAAIGSSFDITRIIFTCLTTSTADLSEFGDLPALLRGVVLRKKNGVYNNVFNVKTNGEMANLMYDFEITTAVNPQQGQNGFKGRLTFGGQSKMGVVLRIDPGEDLQIIIQDDLTGLLQFEIIAEGHEVD